MRWKHLGIVLAVALGVVRDRAWALRRAGVQVAT